MEKQTAIDLLGGTPAKAAKAMGYKVVQTVYMWPEVLPQSLVDQINGALFRLGKKRKQYAPKPTHTATSEGAANA